MTARRRELEPVTIQSYLERMRLDHVAVWTNDLDRLRAFYERYFDARGGARYESTNHPGFASYFLRFPQGESRLELMTIPELAPAGDRRALGYPHVAIGVGSRAAVDSLVSRMANERVPIVTEPHLTGDGYYEAVVRDPDGNLVEITA
jgi:lactoylglutathione lyase